MKKSALLVIFSLMLGSLFLFKPINSASAQSTQPEYNPNPFCSFTPNGAATGNVTLANSCVIYEDINGVANGNLTVNPNTSVTLHHNLVFYPGYKITVSPGAKIFVNSDSKIQQGVICIKKGASGYPVVKTVTGNVESGTGATVTSSALAQMDAVYAANSAACNTANGYYPRESFTSLAYVDTGLGATSFSTSDADMLGLGFTINGVTSTLAAAGDIQVDPAKNLILLPGGAGGKLGIGTTTPNFFIDVNNGSVGKAAVSINQTLSGDILTASSAGSPKFVINNAGNVGIGTTTPAQKLDVAGTIRGGANGYTIAGADTTNPYIDMAVGLAASGINYNHGIILRRATDNGNWTNLGMYSDTGFGIGVLGTNQLNLISSGNVGIGTTSPNSKLTVAFGAGTTEANIKANTPNNLLNLTSNYTAGADYAPGISFSSTDNSPGVSKAGIYSRFTSSGSYLYLGTSNNYASGVTNNAVTIDYSGNVGIGTTAPSQILEANGNLKLTPSNPYLYTGGSYLVIPNGMYISGASIPLYTEARIQARGGISNDTATSLNIYGGTSGNTQFTGTVGITAANTVAYPVIINSTVSSAETAAVQINANNSGLASIYGYALEVNNSDNNTFNGAIKANYKGTNASWSSAVYGTNSANGSGAFGVVGSASYGTGGWFQTSTGTALRVDGKMTVASGEIISTNNNQFRLVWGNYGLIFRQDGTTFYMLPTNSGDQYGSWNALRPFAITMATGYVTFGNGHNDLAELFSVSGKVVKGSIVSIDTSKPKSAIASNDKNSSIIGVVSTTPGAVMNPDGGFHIGYESKDKYENEKTPIALVGTAPTLVTTQKGGISIGDSIAFSSIPGYGAKAVEAGNTVGKAQEAFDPATLSCPSVSSVDAIKWIDDDGMNSKKPCYKLPDGTFVGKIMIYINPSWFDAGSKVTANKLEEQQKQIDSLNTTNSLQAQKIQVLQTAIEALQQKIK